MNGMKKYKGIFVAKGSALHDALEKSDDESVKLAKKIFDDTTENYKKMYSSEDRSWLEYMSRK